MWCVGRRGGEDVSEAGGGGWMDVGCWGWCCELAAWGGVRIALREASVGYVPACSVRRAVRGHVGVEDDGLWLEGRNRHLV